MEILTNLPALLKVGLAFSMLLALHHIKIHLGLSLMLAGCLLGLLMGMSPAEVLTGLAHSLVDTKTISLGLIVITILVLSRLLSESGQLDRIVTSFTGLVHNVRVTSVFMPALIGLLPMPGGALFSAPMVEAACRDSHVAPEDKTVINYWFRHIWEYWWPLYPGVVLAVSLLGVEAWRFMLVQLPLTLVSLVAGIIFLLPKVPARTAEPAPTAPHSGQWSDFRRQVRPITLVVLAIPGVKIVELATGLEFPALTSVFVGLILCLGTVVFQNRLGAGQVARAVFNKAIGPMVLLILGIMAFQNLLIQSQAVGQIQQELTRYGIPSLAVILLVPMLCGFITGIAVGFVGASFPLIVPLLSPYHGFDYLTHASLAYAFGYMGMMLSPVHLCLLVTRDFFAASLLKSYRLLLGPVASVLLAVLIMFVLVS
jgi:hypothetical protein